MVVDVVDAGDLSRLVDAQPLCGMQRPEQRQAARGTTLQSWWRARVLCRFLAPFSTMHGCALRQSRQCWWTGLSAAARRSAVLSGRCVRARC